MITFNKEKICGYLEEETDGVIGIWGMGGVGKTTLLEAINHNFLNNNGDSGINKLFHYVIFITVSREYRPENLQKTIIERLGLRPRDGVSQAQIIYEYLKEKNFLLLLDDIWKVVQLKDLGIPDPRSNNERRFRRKLVFTTRSLQVCGSMKCDKKIEVECLKEVEAWDLFKENVGEGTINLPGIKSRAEEVTKKCGGLPLALVVIGRAMATKESLEEWEYALTQLKNSQPNNIPGMEEEDKYFLLLKFSYDSLRDEEMRKCFLCCSLWSEDYEIEKEELIMCWMGLGLIDGFENIKEAYDEGHTLIRSLIGASLLQPVQGKDGVIKVHDVIRDLALWIARDNGKNKNKWLVKAGGGLEEVPREVVANWKAAERVSLMTNRIEDLPPRLGTCPNLLSLLLQRNEITLIPGGFFNCMPNLTYLDLSGNWCIEEFPKEICCLEKLRYLNLSSTRISSLPEELGQLINLKYLLVRNTHIEGEVISGIIGRLLELEYLDLYPGGSVDIDELLNLRMLKGVGMNITSEHALRLLSRAPVSILHLRIEDMGGDSSSIDLHHLLSSCTKLSLRKLMLIRCHSIRELVGVHLPRLEELQLQELGNLREIVWRRSVVPGPSECFQRLRCLSLIGLPKLAMICDNNHDAVADAAAVIFPSLVRLHVHHCNGLKDITWVLHLPCLEELYLHECEEMEQLVVIGGGGEVRELEVTKPTFPRLRLLTLDSLPKLAKICDNNHDADAAATVNFPSLEVLEVRKCDCLKDITWVLYLPCLESIDLRYCKEMEQLVVIGGGGEVRELEVTKPTFPRLRELSLFDLPKLAMICDNNHDAAAVNFPSLEELYVSECNGLKDITWVLHLPCLEELRLYNCKEMEQVVVIGGGGEEEREIVTKPTFPRLRWLDLDRLPKLAMICDNNHDAAAAVNFPSLELLSVAECKELKRLPFHQQLLNNNNCSRLKSIAGEREWWDGIEWEDQSAHSSLLQPFFHAR